MLLTSGQISLFISSSVVFTFTSLLFLSGYILQQQTVRSLQAAIHPHLPSPNLPTTNPILAKHFGQPPGHSFYDKFLATNRPKGGWAKAAYVQLLRRHIEVCGAVALMGSLMEGESMAQRIILYPRAWDEKPSDGKTRDAHIETSRRLLRKAAKEYKVMLQPIDSIQQGNSSVALTEEEKYPLSTLLSLLHYNRLLLLQSPGLILDSTPLDLLFTLPMSTPVLGLSPPGSPKSHPSLLLLQPSRSTYEEITSSLPEGVYPDTEFLQRVTLESAPTDPEFDTRLLAETGLLEEESGKMFNTSRFLDSTGFVRLRDEGVAGPEYDVGRDEFVPAMPRGKEARRAWERVYEIYRERRMDVCGLDLEPVPVGERNGESNAESGNGGRDGDAEELR